MVPLFLLIVIFCVYGGFASMEPTATSSQHTGWLIGYVVVGFCSLVIAGWILISALRQEGRVTDDWSE